jgi:hypothetical protein
MSHNAYIKAEIHSLDSLKDACKALGFEFMENKTNYAWYGRFMGDYPLPDGMTVDDLGKCLHAIKVPGASYEVGVIRDPMNKDAYRLIWDFWQSGNLESKLGIDAWKLVAEYEKAHIKRVAKLNGLSVMQRNMDGKTRLIVDMGNNKEIITDIIDGTAEIKVTTTGYEGMQCVEESKFLKESLGRVTAQTLLPIAYVEPQKTNEKVRAYKSICG